MVFLAVTAWCFQTIRNLIENTLLLRFAHGLNIKTVLIATGSELSLYQVFAGMTGTFRPGSISISIREFHALSKSTPLISASTSTIKGA